MNTIGLTHRIRVVSSSSPSGSAWSVYVAGECQAVFTGDNARGRALEAALRLAEELRSSGAALVIVEPMVSGGAVTRVVRSRLAS